MSVRNSLVTSVIFTVVSSFSMASHAKDYFISRLTEKFSGSRVRPGDTVTLQGGTRNQLQIENLIGSKDNPIIVRNDVNASEPVTLRRRSASKNGFIFACNTCKHVIIDGTRKWRGAPSGAYCGAPAGKNGCGIRVTSTAGGDAPTVFFRLGGFTSNITVRGVEVDGAWPRVGKGWAGFKLDDVNIKASKHPGVWRENVVFERNYVHDTMREAFYIGPICCGPGGTDRGADTGGLPLRNITIRNNLVNNAGWDGIQLKSAYQGTNRIYGNVIRNVGLDKSKDIPDGEFMGISCSDTQCNVFDNLVVNSGEHGLQARVSALPAKWGPLLINIYNNVSVNAGRAGNERAHGVNVSRASTKVARQKTAIYNNTIVNPRLDGIAVRGANSGSDTRISSNIVAGAGERDIVAPGGSTILRNGAGSLGAFDFVDADRQDFRIRRSSKARDAGSTSLYSNPDMNGVKRPQGARPDMGAYEYH
jgi:hypothetical protein